jgi:hypothetical protein
MYKVGDELLVFARLAALIPDGWWFAASVSAILWPT